MGFQASMSERDAEAFRAMVVGGKSRSFIAARFGMSLDAVRKRISRLAIEAPAGRVFEPVYGPVPFIRAGDGQCRRPLQSAHEMPSATMLVCGQKTPRGHSWCQACARLVFNKTALSRSPTLSVYRNP